MKTVEFVDPKDLETLDHYASSLLSSVYTLKTVQAFHLVALGKGILDNDETEIADAIVHMINKLMAVYVSQMKSVLDRTNISQQQIIDEFRKLFPEFEIPQKHKNAKKNKKPKTPK